MPRGGEKSHAFAPLASLHLRNAAIELSNTYLCLKFWSDCSIETDTARICYISYRKISFMQSSHTPSILAYPKSPIPKGIDYSIFDSKTPLVYNWRTNIVRVIHGRIQGSSASRELCLCYP